MDFFIVFLLILSLCVNITFYWFIKRVFKRSSLLEDATSKILQSTRAFEQHLSAVHELRQYYGDPQLNELVEHTNELAEEMENYRNGFIFETKGEVVDDRYQENTQEE